MDKYKEKIKSYLDKRIHKDYLSLIKNNLSEYEHICIMPMGIAGLSMLNELRDIGISVDFFCDNSIQKIGQKYEGVECISLEELKKKKDNTMVVIETLYYKEIYKQLRELGFLNLERLLTNKFEIDKYLNKSRANIVIDKIFKLIDILEDEESKKIICKIIESWTLKEYEYGFFDDIYIGNQYFNEEVIKLSDKESFVDVGAFTGDTMEKFLKNVNYNFKKIFLFELNKSIYEDLKINISKYNKEISNKIIPYNYGLSKEGQTIKYSDGISTSSISDSGVLLGKVIDLDTILDGESVTFIKMDIEGSEMDALMGAEKTIKRFKPKLAICIYHSAEDLWRIPLYIKKIVPDYKIYIRHHTDMLYETVCYAICD